MKRSYRYAIILVVVLVTSFLWYSRHNRNKAPEIQLPDIALTDLQGNNIILAQFAGKPLVINYWGTWCGPCLQELPELEKLSQHFGDKINLLLVADEPAETIRQFAKQHPYNLIYTISKKTFRQLGIPSVPVTYCYDTQGKLVFTKKDALTALEFYPILAGMIK